MKHIVSLEYQGISLKVPFWLSTVWRHDLPLKDFPSFCGAGSGVGDIIVPEKAYGVVLSPACFIHDVMWSTSYNSYLHFQRSNNTFLTNLKACVKAQLTGSAKYLAYARCYWYWAAVSTLGTFHYDPVSINPWSNRDVQEKLRRVRDAIISD